MRFIINQKIDPIYVIKNKILVILSQDNSLLKLKKGGILWNK